MVKKGKLLAALDSHKGKDYKLEKQKILQKKAEKRKKTKQREQSEDTDKREGKIEAKESIVQLDAGSEGWESDKSEKAAPAVVDISHIDDTDSESDGLEHVNSYRELIQSGEKEEEEEEEEEEGIPLSDIEGLPDEEKADIIPHQRLTINNKAALLKALNSIALPISKLPFSEHQTISSIIEIPIPDVNDDLNRELAFYKQSLDAVTEARILLKREGVPFSRPTDYFAEMVKTDEHMGKIKHKITEEAANKKAAAEARKQRDLKKFGKQVQVAKLQERDKAKRETLDKINLLKRKRKNTDTGNAHEEELFDVALEDASKQENPAGSKKNSVGSRSQNKRQKKDDKFGFGGKKRFSKSGDAASSADLRAFSVKKMKGVKKATQRLVWFELLFGPLCAHDTVSQSAIQAVAVFGRQGHPSLGTLITRMINPFLGLRCSTLSIMANSTILFDPMKLPPLPEYQLSPLPPLISPIPDKLLTLLLPIAAYWGLSMLFHWIDTMDYFPQHRLHTPAEVLKRNRVTRWEVVRDVMVQQVVQTAVGFLLGITEPDDTFGKEEYNVAFWARRIRIAQRAIPKLLSVVGVNPKGLAENLGPSYPMLSGAILGGQYPLLASVASKGGHELTVSVFAEWESLSANTIYWFIIPVLQFGLGIMIVDTWQYFLHRAMHMNKWLYNTLHSRHHRLYVPYAYGALYNHPIEGFLLDTLGAGIAYKVAGMSTRQAMCFFTCLTLKTVDDHSGYSLPWDPIQYLSSNNAAYHDVHHQSWGIKTNFSQPCSTFWDRVLGTMWTGGDLSARYERARIAAQQQVDHDLVKISKNSDAAESRIEEPRPFESALRDATNLQSINSKNQQPLSLLAGKAERQATKSRQQVLDDTTDGGPQVLKDEAREEKEASWAMLKQRRTPASVTQADSFKGIRDRISGSMHGRTRGVLGMESSR